ncbi:hypothetical protein ACQR2D_28970 [Bradyrhizobium sp. HKCCYLRH2057]|uniref:hypothetical protein n=1 Tax=unclassified Bradyrhizobium TaxID=2631580 RepID=UPI003EB6A8EF
MAPMVQTALWMCVFILISMLRSADACAQEPAVDRERYYDAVNHCRHAGQAPMSLSPDKRVLCFDGVLAENMDVSSAKDLHDGGLFVVRSFGGHTIPAVTLSDIVRDRRATVVVYDHCLSACAQFLLVASDKTYILKDTLVAWHYPQGLELCTYLEAPRDGEPKKVQRGPCRQGGEHGFTYERTFTEFFKDRAVKPPLSLPTDSLYVRRIVRNLYAESGVFRDVMWTLHPRYYPSLFKTKITYEAYPESQDEVDDMVKRLGLSAGRSVKVIYDP